MKFKLRGRPIYFPIQLVLKSLNTQKPRHPLKQTKSMQTSHQTKQKSQNSLMTTQTHLSSKNQQEETHLKVFPSSITNSLDEENVDERLHDAQSSLLLMPRKWLMLRKWLMSKTR